MRSIGGLNIIVNEIQKVQLNILIKLDEVCRRHGLRYYIAYGTCIGAVREKGFIPWDHDIDVLMYIDDARKLIDYQDELIPNYFVSSYLNDDNNHSIAMKLYDKKVLCKVIKNGKISRIDNAFIDIYPFYKCPPSRMGLLLNIWCSHLYKLLISGVPENHGFIAKQISKFAKYILSNFDENKIIKLLEMKLNYTGNSCEITDYFGRDISLMSAITYNKEWFDYPSKLEFEGRTFYGPTNPNEYLEKRYGDYMKPVTAEEAEKEDKLELIMED